jgi:hypothetical protein
MRVFHDLEPPRSIRQVRFEREVGRLRWYAVTGWNLNGTTTPAVVRKVDDSGEGVVLLLSGGTAGLRFQPVGASARRRKRFNFFSFSQRKIYP